MVNKAGIYRIENKVNGKFYIGSAVNLRHRFKNHRYHLRKNKHHCLPLQRAWNKYGEENFEFIILASVLNINDLIALEQYFLDILRPFNTVGYNVSKMAGSNLGTKRSEETRKKMSEAQRGIKNHGYGKKYSEERRKQISERIRGNGNPFYGKKHTPEALAKTAEGRRIYWERRKKSHASTL